MVEKKLHRNHILDNDTDHRIIVVIPRLHERYFGKYLTLKVIILREIALNLKTIVERLNWPYQSIEERD